MKEENIKEAIEGGAVWAFGIPLHGKVRFYFYDGGKIPKSVYLTVEEHRVYKKVTNLTKREKLKRLGEYMKNKIGTEKH